MKTTDYKIGQAVKIHDPKSSHYMSTGQVSMVRSLDGEIIYEVRLQHSRGADNWLFSSSQIHLPAFELERAPATTEKKDTFCTASAKQKVLFAGMDCLPGQLDLFDTDGHE